MGVGGWLDQVGIRLTQLSTGLKVEAELGNILIFNCCWIIDEEMQFDQDYKTLTINHLWQHSDFPCFLPAQSSKYMANLQHCFTITSSFLILTYFLSSFSGTFIISHVTKGTCLASSQSGTCRGCLLPSLWLCNSAQGISFLSSERYFSSPTTMDLFH